MQQYCKKVRMEYVRPSSTIKEIVDEKFSEALLAWSDRKDPIAIQNSFGMTGRSYEVVCLDPPLGGNETTRFIACRLSIDNPGIDITMASGDVLDVSGYLLTLPKRPGDTRRFSELAADDVETAVGSAYVYSTNGRLFYLNGHMTEVRPDQLLPKLQRAEVVVDPPEWVREHA